LDLFVWTEAEFMVNLQGSPIRRIGYESWLRNIAIALGNAESDDRIIKALKQKQNHESEVVREHVQWALDQHSEFS
jgi:epoxyqueuosine reductase